MQKRRLCIFNNACIVVSFQTALSWGVSVKAAEVKVRHHVGSHQKVSAVVRIHWLEFDTETFSAVTPLLLMNVNKSHQTFHVKAIGGEDVSTLYRLLKDSGRPGNFTSSLTRLVVVNGKGEKILVDRDGNVFDGKHSIALAPNEFVRLNNFLLRRVFEKEIVAEDERMHGWIEQVRKNAHKQR